MQTIAIGGRNNDRVNVLEVIGNASMGGMENYLKSFIRQLQSDQFNFTCICPNESPFTEALRELGVEEVYITPIADDPIWRAIQLTSEVARLHKIDILHAHMPKAHVLAGLAGLLVNKPVVATIHGMNVTSHELGITRAVGSYLVTNCQEAYTQALAMGVTADCVSLVRNGVDTDLFTPESCSKQLRNTIDIAEDTRLVGFVGRLEPEKGPDLFLRAADYVHQCMPNAHFAIIGEGSMHNQLYNLCKHFGLERHVHFVGWMENTEEIYPALDLLVHTSRSDGTSLVLLEAMACECATVGLAVGGVPEIIENESTELLAGAGDWEGVGRRVVQLLNNSEMMHKMGKAARRRLKQKFNLKTNTQLTGNLLRNIAFSSSNNKEYSSNSSFIELRGKSSVDSSAS